LNEPIYLVSLSKAGLKEVKSEDKQQRIWAQAGLASYMPIKLS